MVFESRVFQILDMQVCGPAAAGRASFPRITQKPGRTVLPLGHQPSLSDGAQPVRHGEGLHQRSGRELDRMTPVCLSGLS